MSRYRPERLSSSLKGKRMRKCERCGKEKPDVTQRWTPAGDFPVRDDCEKKSWDGVKLA